MSEIQSAKHQDMSRYFLGFGMEFHCSFLIYIHIQYIMELPYMCGEEKWMHKVGYGLYVYAGCKRLCHKEYKVEWPDILET